MSQDSKAKDPKSLETKHVPTRSPEATGARTIPTVRQEPGEDVAATIYELLGKDYPTEEEFKKLLEHVSPGVLAKRYLCGIGIGIGNLFARLHRR